MLTALKLGRITTKTVVNPYDDDTEKVKACRCVEGPTEAIRPDQFGRGDPRSWMCTSNAALVRMANNKDPQMNEAPAYTEGTEEVGIQSPTSKVMWLTTPMPLALRMRECRR